MRRALLATAAAALATVSFAADTTSAYAGTIEVEDKQQRHAHEAIEHRVGKDWTYIPNYGYKCTEVGCCGAPTPERPDRQACGPEFWKFLTNDTAARCVSSTGGQQSPINFQTVGNDTLTFEPITKRTGESDDGKKAAKLDVSKNLCQGKLEFLAATWEVVFDKNCTLHVDVLGKRWHLVQWHLHNAEHSVNGLYYPLEVHMVHMNDDNEALVIGTFLTTGPNNRFFDQLTHADEATRLAPLDPYEILPQDGKFWHYKGSLTTPPCQTKLGKHVEWFSMQTPMTISVDQMFTFTSYFANLEKAYDGHVNRPIQDVLATTDIFVNDAPAPAATPSRKRKNKKIGNIRRI